MKTLQFRQHKLLTRELLLLFFWGAAFIFSVTNIKAQTSGVSSDGKDFYIGLINPGYNTVADPVSLSFFGVSILVSSFTDNTIKVSYFDRNTGTESVAQTFSIPARTGKQIALNTIRMQLNKNGEIAEYASCHVTAEQPINIEYFSVGPCGGGSYLALETPALGNRYVIESYNDNPGYGALLSSENPPGAVEVSEGFFLIIAPFDSTNVVITPNSTTMGGHTGVHTGLGSNGKEIPFTITLNRGQCYFVKSGGNTVTDDISGSLVQSSKPIAVLSGHENAMIGEMTGTLLDSRDFMVEQMIPVDYWDTGGYVSLPLKESVPYDSTLTGIGENYRVYAFDSTAQRVLVHYTDTSSALQLNPQKLASPTPEVVGAHMPVSFSNPYFDESNPKEKFSVMMYDRRILPDHPVVTSPVVYPAPSMMTIIPIARWKTSFMWFVPDNKFEVLQGYYVNVIALDSDLTNDLILASYNGGALKPIGQVLKADTALKGFNHNTGKIPQHPELYGIRFLLKPGSYYAIGPRPFIVYNYGFRGFDDSFDLGDFEGDDYFFEYAAPAGASLRSGDHTEFAVTIDTQCGKWNVCVKDNRKNSRGIRSVTLLNDSMGIQYSPGKQSFNCKLDPAVDSSNFGEIELPGTDSSYCFSVFVNNPLQTASAAILVTDNAGNLSLTELRYNPPNFTMTPGNSILNFGILNVGADTCMSLALKNTEQSGGQSHTVANAHITGNQSSQVMISSIPPLPAILAPHDSLVMKICLKKLVTGDVLDTLVFGIDCFTNNIRVVAKDTTSGRSIVKAIPNDVDILIKPNPAKNNIEVSLLNPEEFIAKYELLDILGVKRKQGKTSENSLKIDISDLPSGNYYLRVVTLGGAAITKQVVIIR